MYQPTLHSEHSNSQVLSLMEANACAWPFPQALKRLFGILYMDYPISNIFIEESLQPKGNTSVDIYLIQVQALHGCQPLLLLKANFFP